MATACLSSSPARAILALWVAGLGAGGLYLSVGAEYLAWVQWVVGTLVTVSLIFYAVSCDPGPPPSRSGGTPLGPPFRRGVFWSSPGFGLQALICGSLFTGLVYWSASSLEATRLPNPVVEPLWSPLARLGVQLSGPHLVAVEVLGLTLFLVVVGGGVIARVGGRPGVWH